MIIRHDQMASLAQVAQDGFVEKSVRHMQSFSPYAAQAAGETAVRKCAEAGLAAARGYGFQAEGSLMLYLDLMVLFGHHFDHDPQYGWLHRFLRPIDGLGPLERSRLLYWHATAYLHRAYGETGEVSARIAERVLDLTVDRLERASRFRGDQLILWLHPERRPFLESEVITAAWNHAPTAGFADGAAPALYLLITFLFGNGALTDPLHGWLQPLPQGPGANYELLRRVQSRAAATRPMAVEAVAG